VRFRVVTATVLLVATLVGAPQMPAAPARAPVSPRQRLLATLAVALARSGVTVVVQRADLAVAAAALRLAARDGAGGAELAGIVSQDAVLARRVGLTPPRAGEVFTEIAANTSYLAAHAGYPALYARVQIGDFVYERYAGQGLRLQPLASFWLIRDIARHGDTATAAGMLDAALAVSQTWRNSRFLEYLFPFGGGVAPWHSPMADALAMDASARLWRQTRDDSFRVAALAFAADAVSHVVISRDGAWFPIYPFAPDDQILNGDMQVLIGLFRIADLPGAAVFAPVRTAAFAALLAHLPRYDTGAWSRYDQATEATLAYHDLMTSQLFELARLTANTPELLRYWKRFVAYRSTPPRITAAPDTPGPFFPWRQDGVNTTVTIRFRVDKPSTVTLVIGYLAGGIVSRVPLGASASGSRAVVWAPGPIPVGTYTVTVIATDLAGNTGHAPALIRVRAERVTTPPVIGRIRLRGSRLGWAIRDRATTWVTLLVRTPRGTRSLARVALSGTATLPALPTSITVTDANGNSATWRRPR
jgi:hypothetical protein